MQNRVVVVLAAFAGAAFGSLLYQPLARAVESLAVVGCSATTACNGGANASSGPGVSGRSSSGYGMLGQTTFDSTSSVRRAGVYGQDLSNVSYYGSGVYGSTNHGFGLFGYARGAEGVGLEGQALLSTGVFGYSQQSSAMIAQTDDSSGSPIVSAIQLKSPFGAKMLIGWDKYDSAVLNIDNEGNILTTGMVYSGGSCSMGCSRTRRVRSYGAWASSPTLEDTGESHLIAGYALVRLDPAFANAIDPKLGYYVLLTPEGDTRGLYVDSRSLQSFVVRETTGGRSSISFAYRIVGHPYGDRSQRLPFVDLPTSVRNGHSKKQL